MAFLSRLRHRSSEVLVDELWAMGGKAQWGSFKCAARWIVSGYFGGRGLGSRERVSIFKNQSRGNFSRGLASIVAEDF
jgi:hypothetical protein